MYTNIQDNKKRLLELLKEHAFFKEKITLSSGKQSDYYIDARRVTLSPEGVYLCAKIILDMIKDDNIDAAGGPTLGADSILGALGSLSFQENMPLNTFIVRKAPKPYGKQQQIEGPILKENARVVVIDDVATTGKSFVRSIEVLRKLGAQVVKAICIVDRHEGARDVLAGIDCDLISIFDSSDFLKE